jgi:hypothetical protein
MGNPSNPVDGQKFALWCVQNVPNGTLVAGTTVS